MFIVFFWWIDFIHLKLNIIIKTTERGILFNQNPRRNHQAETLSPKDEGFLPWWFLRGFWLNRIPHECGFYFYPVIPWIYIFMGNYFCFHTTIDLRFFSSNLLSLNVHSNCLFLDNHLVSKQPQWQCHVTKTWQWGHVTKQILNPTGWDKFKEIKTNDLTTIWAWYNHQLLTYTFLCPCDAILCTNNCYKANGDQFSVWSGASF